MALNDKKVSLMLPSDKRYRKSDSGGLFIEVSPNGTKTWKLAYRFDGNQRSQVLGIFPEVSAVDAATIRDQAKRILKQGKDPVPKPVEKDDKATEDTEGDTWRIVAKEYRDRRVMQKAAPLTIKKMEILIVKTLPGIGDTPVRDLRPVDLLPILRIEEANGRYETATRLRTLMGQIFRYAVATGRANSDQARDLKGAILPPDQKHHAGLVNPKDVGGLMRSIRGYNFNPIYRNALLILAYTFVRPGELRLAKWTEIEGDTWIIPAERMKGKTLDLHL